MQNIDLCSVSGENLQFPISITYNGGIQNITGWAIYFIVKQFQTDSDSSALINIEVTSHLFPITGQSFLSAAGTITANLTGQYYYQFSLVDNLGNRITPIGGTYTFGANLLQNTVGGSSSGGTGATIPLFINLQAAQPIVATISI